MGATPIRVGATVPLTAKLNDGQTTKFVRATVFDHVGGAVPGSPFTLTHVGNGVYQNASLNMPEVPFITVCYEAFNDAGFTSRAGYDTKGATFNRDDFASANTTIVLPTNVRVDVLDEPGVDVIAEDEENNTVIATVDDQVVEVGSQDNEVEVGVNAKEDPEVVVWAEEGET